MGRQHGVAHGQSQSLARVLAPRIGSSSAEETHAHARKSFGHRHRGRGLSPEVLVSVTNCPTPVEGSIFDRGGFSMLAYESARGWGLLGGMMVAGSVLVFPSAVLAQSAPAPAAVAAEPTEPSPHIDLTGRSPKIDLSAPPPPAPVTRNFRQHDGFYLRIGGGLGALGADFDRAGFDASSGGTSLELEALVGGSPSPGLAIGGGLL